MDMMDEEKQERMRKEATFRHIHDPIGRNISFTRVVRRIVPCKVTRLRLNLVLKDMEQKAGRIQTTESVLRPSAKESL